jgi:flagellar biosynthetic protein FliR
VTDPAFQLSMGAQLGGQLTAFGLVFFRAAALVTVAPILGARPVPARVRVLLAIVLTIGAMAHVPHAPILDDGALLVAIARETFFGLVVGATARAFLEAAQAAGHTLGLSAGLGFGATLDPTSGAQSSAIGELANALALLWALSLGLHRELIAWFVSSVAAVPPGAHIDMWALAEATIRTGIEAIALAVRIAIPIAAVTTCVHILLGMVSRVVPQMSLGNLGFAVPLLAGGWAFSRGADAAAAVTARAAIDSVRNFLEML